MQSATSPTHIARETLSADIRNWHQQALKCFGGNEEFINEHRHGFRILRKRTPEAETALEFLLPDPDRAFECAHILKPGSRTHAGVIEIGDKKYVLKRYNCRGWAYRIGNAFRRSRAVRTWLVNWEYLVRGVPVPQPLLCLEERRFRLLERSYVLMEFAEKARPLRERWLLLDTAAREGFLKFLGGTLGQMHCTGMLHGDLKWDNILVGSEPSLETLRLVDLDGSTAIFGFSRARAEKDLARFLKDLAREDGNILLQDCLKQAWEQVVASSIMRVL